MPALTCLLGISQASPWSLCCSYTGLLPPTRLLPPLCLELSSCSFIDLDASLITPLVKYCFPGKAPWASPARSHPPIVGMWNSLLFSTRFRCSDYSLHICLFHETIAPFRVHTWSVFAQCLYLKDLAQWLAHRRC